MTSELHMWLRMNHEYDRHKVACLGMPIDEPIGLRSSKAEQRIRNPQGAGSTPAGASSHETPEERAVRARWHDGRLVDPGEQCEGCAGLTAARIQFEKVERDRMVELARSGYRVGFIAQTFHTSSRIVLRVIAPHVPPHVCSFNHWNLLTGKWHCQCGVGSIHSSDRR